jgi:hypothetical protein
MPATRTPVRSRGPVTEEGKARASRNAIRHGLTATHHLVLEDEVPGDFVQRIETITAETGATSEIEARLARRLAIAFWKGERAERIETALFDAAPTRRPPQRGFEREEADPLTSLDICRPLHRTATRGTAANLLRPNEPSQPFVFLREPAKTTNPRFTPQNEP